MQAKVSIDGVIHSTNSVGGAADTPVMVWHRQPPHWLVHG